MAIIIVISIEIIANTEDIRLVSRPDLYRFLPLMIATNPKKLSLVRSYSHSLRSYQGYSHLSHSGEAKNNKVASYLVLGMRTLCWNNFWNNRMEKESGKMLE